MPNTIGGQASETISPFALSTARSLEYWVVENAKSARHFLKSISPILPLQSIRMELLDKDTPTHLVGNLLDIVEKGQDVGVLSEAGCPGVADPGAEFVRLAHQRSLTVVPLVGPSSILLALMASGLNGQKFTFHGYLPVDINSLRSKIQDIEWASRRNNSTEIFIETPYRNERLALHLIENLASNTLLCIATSLTAPDQMIRTMAVSAWRKIESPVTNGAPTVFLILANGLTEINEQKPAPPKSTSRRNH